jgi:hypothetical protein
VKLVFVVGAEAALLFATVGADSAAPTLQSLG